MTLYELTEDYMNLLALAEDPDIDEQAFMDTLDGIEGAIEVKADNYARVMRQLEADAAACDAESKRLKNKAKTIDNNIKRMKQALQFAMQATGKTKFKTQLFSFYIQKNSASVVMDELYIENIPNVSSSARIQRLTARRSGTPLMQGRTLKGLHIWKAQRV